MKTDQSFVTDIKMIRERARKHIEQGALTPAYRAKPDRPNFSSMPIRNNNMWT